MESVGIGERLKCLEGGEMDKVDDKEVELAEEDGRDNIIIRLTQ